MPIYVYAPTKGEVTCAFCEPGFEYLQKLNEAYLECCPECGARVERKITAPNLSSTKPSLDESNIGRHGFTQYRKVEKGVYEKTVGKGPDYISDKQKK